MSGFEFTGTIVADCKLTYVRNGTAKCEFRVVRNDRYRSPAGRWVDRPGVFMLCTAWGELAKNIAQSLGRGDRVILWGTLSQNRYRRPGEQQDRIVTEIRVEDAAPSLRDVTAVPYREHGMPRPPALPPDVMAELKKDGKPAGPAELAVGPVASGPHAF